MQSGGISRPSAGDACDRYSGRVRPSAERAPFGGPSRTHDQEPVRFTLSTRPCSCGVAESVSELIAEHQSIERALAQVLMPRMEKPNSSRSWIPARLNMTMTQPAKHQIVALSQGLPHYTHLLGLYSARAAVEGRRLEIRKADVRTAIDSAVTSTHQSLVDSYRTAVSSPQSANLYGRVLLACARARVDEFGFFAASDVREPMSAIMGKKYDIPSYAKHLKHFCAISRAGAANGRSGKPSIGIDSRIHSCRPL